MGDKKDPSTTKIKIEGVSLLIQSKDFWEGPVTPCEEGHYSRGFWIE